MENYNDDQSLDDQSGRTDQGEMAGCHCHKKYACHS